MSIDAGGVAHMTYHNNSNSFSGGSGLATPGSGFGGGRSRLNNKRLSVALPPKINSIDEHQVDNPTPRTSRSHLLAGLRTQPKTPASAPYHQVQHQVPAMSASGYSGYEQAMPQSAMANGFDLAASHQYASNAGRQMYSLPEQVLAPPSLNEHGEEMDPAVLQQMQLTSMYLAQRQQQLQQQLANITAAAQGLNMGGNGNGNVNVQGNNMPYPQQQNYMSPQMMQNAYGQQQMQSPMEVPGQPGVYLVYNPAIQGYTYVVDQQAQLQQQQQYQQQQAMSPLQQAQSNGYSNSLASGISPPATERSTPTNLRSFTPPKKAPSPPFTDTNKPVEPLPPPSSNAFRRGHKKAPSSISILNNTTTSDGPKTSSNATFGSQRTVFPPTPMTGTFQPGAARAGEHPLRQPRGPPPLEELTNAPTSRHEGSKNFATRQRRRAIDSLVKAGFGRRSGSSGSGTQMSPAGIEHRASANGSPVGSDSGHSTGSGPAADAFFGAASHRRMSPIGSEMKEKRMGSPLHPASGSSSAAASDGGYFGLSSASSSSGDGEDGNNGVAGGVSKLPLTPLEPTAPGAFGGGAERKSFLGVLNAAEKRRTASGGAVVF